ncbi:YbjQ family protein [Salirhabdus salicampi]|uniref:YbjQ family protein n=1 Tax=Salirhabdus salicampi TaxID=476102 RepID=UPI0020C597B6|nr:YbjQ family protein [Salirhabdus salicampi]MCP8615722.1 heavy metal-binding domain-containing protein [Salirhabdus salicampi]
MIIVTTNEIPGKDMTEVIGFVKGSTIQSKHVGKDIMASLKTIVGGEIKEYNDMFEKARQLAIGRMVKNAEDLGANAIVGMRLQTSAIMSGASEIVAYGTAVKVK